MAAFALRLGERIKFELEGGERNPKCNGGGGVCEGCAGCGEEEGEAQGEL